MKSAGAPISSSGLACIAERAFVEATPGRFRRVPELASLKPLELSVRMLVLELLEGWQQLFPLCCAKRGWKAP
jgi:hypothetical protein